MLTAENKKVIQQVWEKVKEDFGAEALERLFCTYPQTKTYFPHFDLKHGSDQVRNHGKKVVNALSTAVKNLDNLSQALAELSNLHAYNLRVDPEHRGCSGGAEPRFAFQLLAQCFQVVMAVHLGKDYTPEAHAAIDKFLTAVAAVLAEKYR
ncbi:Hemoglobin subunit alpha-2 [Leptosomus discolor]|uniref:Hemoglobin subunit alpha-2 n=1 Tax=Leptosomus discolor TaxID=188344 RepID=A0A091PI32_LEPDC|nr:Hemoglobin subunit alpha-2 [Leptosomus discolor]